MMGDTVIHLLTDGEHVLCQKKDWGVAVGIYVWPNANGPRCPDCRRLLTVEKREEIIADAQRRQAQWDSHEEQ